MVLGNLKLASIKNSIIISINNTSIKEGYGTPLLLEDIDSANCTLKASGLYEAIATYAAGSSIENNTAKYLSTIRNIAGNGNRYSSSTVLKKSCRFTGKIRLVAVPSRNKTIFPLPKYCITLSGL
jgi:hypothetical protein